MSHQGFGLARPLLAHEGLRAAPGLLTRQQRSGAQVLGGTSACPVIVREDSAPLTGEEGVRWRFVGTGLCVASGGMRRTG
jgi:hypothetical protein